MLLSLSLWAPPPAPPAPAGFPAFVALPRIAPADRARPGTELQLIPAAAAGDPTPQLDHRLFLDGIDITGEIGGDRVTPARPGRLVWQATARNDVGEISASAELEVAWPAGIWALASAGPAITVADAAAPPRHPVVHQSGRRIGVLPAGTWLLRSTGARIDAAGTALPPPLPPQLAVAGTRVRLTAWRLAARSETLDILSAATAPRRPGPADATGPFVTIGA